MPIPAFSPACMLGWAVPLQGRREPASCSVWVVSPRTTVPAGLLPSASNFAASLWLQTPCGLLDPASSTSDLSPLVLWDHHWVVCCLEELGVLGPPPTTGLRYRSYSSLPSGYKFILPYVYCLGPVPLCIMAVPARGLPPFCLPHSCSGDGVRRSGSRPEVIGLEKFLVVLTWVLLALNVWRLGVLLGTPLCAGWSCSQEARVKGRPRACPAGCSCALRSSLASHAPRTALSCAPTPTLLCTDTSSATEAKPRSTSPLPAKQSKLEWPLHLLGACPDPSLHVATSAPHRVLSRASGHWTRESCLLSALGGL